MEGHPRARRDWQWEVELPFRQTFWDEGDVATATEAWVVVPHFQDGSPLVGASATPNTLENEGPAGCR
eukprot:12887738-Prorocentrum_lima.AAC.1